MFKHEHADRYLAVDAKGFCWAITPDINSNAGCVQSASAGSVCPAHLCNRVNNRIGWRSWLYSNVTEWTAADIEVTCDTHDYT